jgi:phosphoadenosine phosphosulfate reductase
MNLSAHKTITTTKISPSEMSVKAQELSRFYEDMRTIYALEHMLSAFEGQIAMSTSFGADSIVSLHLMAQLNPDLPILFLDTDRHFLQTLSYRDEMVEKLKLTNLITLKPDPDEVNSEDQDGTLYAYDTDACCALRKIRPMDRVINSYGAWISGRKRHQAFSRHKLPIVEYEGGHFKLNPLARWSQQDIEAYMKTHNLMPHPLVGQGFRSIGCWPCTKPVETGADPRSGRWEGSDKTECGLHRPVFGGDNI